MKLYSLLAFAIAMAAPIAAYATEETAPVVHYHVHHHHHYHAATTHTATPELARVAPAPTPARPVAPPAVQNDSDGLSTDPEDCNKGCLGNTQ